MYRHQGGQSMHSQQCHHKKPRTPKCKADTGESQIDTCSKIASKRVDKGKTKQRLVIFVSARSNPKFVLCPCKPWSKLLIWTMVMVPLTGVISMINYQGSLLPGGGPSQQPLVQGSFDNCTCHIMPSKNSKVSQAS